MTLVSAIIQRAYRVGNILPIGQNPSTNEVAEGLELLSEVTLSILGNEAGESLADLPIGNNNVSEPNDWVPDAPSSLPLNCRLVCNLEAADTLYLNPRPQDGSRLAVIDASGNFATRNLTLNGNGRLVEGASTAVLSTNSLDRQWMYRADTANWVRIDDLSSGDTFPFPVEFNRYFALELALLLNPQHSASLASESIAALEGMRAKIRSRYTQVVPVAADRGVMNGRAGGGSVFRDF